MGMRKTRSVCNHATTQTSIHANTIAFSIKQKRPLSLAYCSVAMADALLTSRAVFRSRASELMLEPGAIDKAVEEGIGSMGQFGFACRFVPGLLTAFMSYH